MYGRSGSAASTFFTISSAARGSSERCSGNFASESAALAPEDACYSRLARLALACRGLVEEVPGASWGKTGSTRPASRAAICARSFAVRSHWLQLQLTRLTLLTLLSSTAVSCSEPISRSQVIVLIDADSEVRSLVADVDAVVEIEDAAGGGFQTRVNLMRNFKPNTQHTWPLSFRFQPLGSELGGTFQLTATGRKAAMQGVRGGVAAQARIIDKLKQGETLVLRVVFEAECYARSELCDYPLTCADGNCVAADSKPYGKPRSIPDGGVEQPPPDTDSGMQGTIESAMAGIVQEGGPCDGEGARGCSGHGTRTPLACESGMWRAQSECAENERCDTSLARRGMCQPMAQECINRMPEVPFCDASETMRMCKDLVYSEVIACSTNERCVPLPGSGVASCECKTGFSEDAAGCREATTCANNGGCDPMTTCTPMAGKRVCGECPPEYTGDGTKGCSPLLTSLSAAEGTLVPAFSPKLFDYTLKVGLTAQRATFTATAPVKAQIKLNGSAVAAGAAMPSQILPLGPSKAEILVSAERGVPAAYRVAIERTGVQSAYLKASKSGSVDHFGYSLALAGDTLVVGAFYEDSKATGVNGDDGDNSVQDSGAVYVFVRNGTSWTQQAYLKANDTSTNSFFGTSVAISGDTIAVGQIEDDIFNPAIAPTRPGSVYVFVRQGTTWTQQAKLTAMAGEPGDMLGASVSIDGDSLAVGASRGDGDVHDSGTAVLFQRSGTTWTEAHTFKASMAAEGSLFGSEIGVSGNVVAVAAQEEGVSVSRGGGVYVFEGSGASWGPPQRLQPPMPIQDATFGFGMALHGKTIAVGAPRAEFIALSTVKRPAGEVYLFERGTDKWMPTAVVKASNAAQSDYFGFSVALTDDAMFVGAVGEASTGRGLNPAPTQASALYSGAAYLFARNGTDWAQNGYFKASNTDQADGFGYNVVMSKTSAAVAAIYEASNASGIDGNQADNSSTNAGAVYVFQ